MYKNPAHHNMVEQQLRPWEVLDPRVIDAFVKLPREDFVSEAQKSLAYSDLQLPIGYGEKMLEPKIEGRMLQSMEIQKTDSVLEVGTGSGFVTALIATLARAIDSVEINQKIADFGAENLKKANIDNAKLIVTDALSQTFKAPGTYDIVVLTGSTRIVPEHLKSALKIGGRMFVMYEKSHLALACKMVRINESEWLEEELFETISVPLIQGPAPKVFSF